MFYLYQSNSLCQNEYVKWSKDKETFGLGEVQFVCVDQQKATFVANMLAQHGVRKNDKDRTTYTDYDALRLCLRKVARFALKIDYRYRCLKLVQV